MAKKNNKREAELQKRELKKAATIAKKSDDLIRRHYFGVVDPKAYFKRCLAVRILSILPTITDNCLADIQDIGGVEFRDPKMIKLQKEANTAVNRLLKHIHADHVDTFLYLGEDLQSAKRHANDFADVSTFVHRMLELVCGYCSDVKEEWRIVKLMEVSQNLLTDEAEDEKIRQCKAYCLGKLKEWKVAGIEEAAARGLKPSELNLRVVPEECNIATKALRNINIKK